MRLTYMYLRILLPVSSDLVVGLSYQLLGLFQFSPIADGQFNISIPIVTNIGHIPYKGRGIGDMVIFEFQPGAQTRLPKMDTAE